MITWDPFHILSSVTEFSHDVKNADVKSIPLIKSKMLMSVPLLWLFIYADVKSSTLTMMKS